MSQLIFEWDLRKDAANQKKHGVSFDEARSVFTDEYGRLIADPDHSGEEDRFILLGTSINARLLLVCHCIRDGESIRIISARRANKRETKVYQEYRYA
ncbi:BrnT family toxin [Halopseudomonas salegens]|uniref:BrnT family toxin n=1 Tax=Halopseudomonas salegens TaxID=1434072 RepID=A0A1H2HRH3_9GAMM|nr:BrnT family toxin [Halopseudomonas salegens]SDU34319.1 hypothetical protein SAMN05216210_3244 [Halopseudomonas salegens]